MGNRVSRNGVSHAICRHGAGRQAIRFTALVLANAVVLCVAVGCDLQQLTIREAYQIPEPKHALLQQHATPRCKFGAPGKLSVKTENGWTPYSGKPEKKPASKPSPKTGVEGADPAKSYALLVKERNCYQQAEVKVRKKLHQLQSSVDSTIAALEQETRGRVGVKTSDRRHLAAQGR